MVDRVDNRVGTLIPRRSGGVAGQLSWDPVSDPGVVGLDCPRRGPERNMNTMTRNRRRHTPEQIIRKLAEGNRLQAAGQDLDEVCRTLEITSSTWHRWVAQYGGMKANDAKRLKELESENARLKKLVANQALDIDMLREVAKGEF